jgi:hypothetical protein
MSWMLAMPSKPDVELGERDYVQLNADTFLGVRTQQGLAR